MAFCKVELKTELERSLSAGAMTDRFCVIAEEVASGWYSQRSALGWAHAVDDVMGMFRVRLSKHWKKLDPELNPSAAITQQVRWAGMDWQRKQDAQKKRELRAEGLLAEDLEARR